MHFTRAGLCQQTFNQFSSLLLIIHVHNHHIPLVKHQNPHPSTLSVTQQKSSLEKAESAKIKTTPNVVAWRHIWIFCLFLTAALPYHVISYPSPPPSPELISLSSVTSPPPFLSPSQLPISEIGKRVTLPSNGIPSWSRSLIPIINNGPSPFTCQPFSPLVPCIISHGWEYLVCLHNRSTDFTGQGRNPLRVFPRSQPSLPAPPLFPYLPPRPSKLPSKQPHPPIPRVNCRALFSHIYRVYLAPSQLSIPRLRLPWKPILETWANCLQFSSREPFSLCAAIIFPG